MVYDKEGIGIAEMTELALYLPEVFDTITDELDNGGNEKEILTTARKAITAYNLGVIGG